ncbi:uncharacterized protein [Palaemon carinicauda]|uniref:uncharacterized protein isoform X1 n=1 Tax=Palaemon carinicauda TaxID=392227 RepID=UPI0035B5AE2C
MSGPRRRFPKGSSPRRIHVELSRLLFVLLVGLPSFHTTQAQESPGISSLRRDTEVEVVPLRDPSSASKADHPFVIQASPSTPPDDVASHFAYDYDDGTFVDSLVIHKCCAEKDVFDQATKQCQPSDEITFSVPVFSVDYHGMYTESNLTRDKVELQTQMLECEKYLLDVEPGKKPEFDFRVLDTGQLWVPEYEQYYDQEHYCLENFVANASVRGSPHIMGAMVCVLETQVETFDPSKIPVRKCCMHDEVWDASSSCTARMLVTNDPWLVPVKSAHQETAISSSSSSSTEKDHLSSQSLLSSSKADLVDIRQYPYSETHEVVPNFQTCVGEQMGWEVDNFYLETETGHLFVPNLNRLIPGNQYCIEDFHINGTIEPKAYVCVSESEKQRLQHVQTPGCQKELCVSKCCPLGSILDAASKRCVSSRLSFWLPKVAHSNFTSSLVMDADFKFGFPDCPDLQLTYSHELVQMQTDGSLQYTSNVTDECNPLQVYTVPKGQYCIDQVHYPSGELREGAAFCFRDEWEHLGKLEKLQDSFIYPVFLAISDLFILISFIVYLTVPDQNKRGLNKNVKLAHSVLGRILLSFLFSLFFAYLFLIIVKLFSDPINLASPSACIGIGVCVYMFFMATFFWLNVLCFELWWKCARQESSSGRRWVWYQVYAWISPLVFGGVSLIMEFAPSISNCYIKPNFGKYSCFFSYSVTHNNAAKWAYFFGPVAVLLVADLIFFILTVRSLLVTVQQSHKGTVQRQARQRLKLCFKLFLVMGISWLAEIIAFELGPRTVWYISDVFNCFQGFIIFLIFILKPKILEAVRVRVYRCCCSSAPPAKPRGRMDFSSVTLSNSSGTDEFSLSNQQLSLARGHDHARIHLSYSGTTTSSISSHRNLSITRSSSIQKDSPLAYNVPPSPPRQLHVLSLENHLSKRRISPISAPHIPPPLPPSLPPPPPTPPADTDGDDEGTPTSTNSSPLSSRSSTPRTNSTRASLSASCKSVDEGSC